MLSRYLKIDLALFLALFCLFYATQNVVNLDQAFGAVSYVLSMADHQAYPDHFGPPLTSAPLVWLAVIVIIALEFTAGIFAAKGTWDLWAARKQDAALFNEAKRWITLAGGMALFVWFGLFATIGGAYFQMWQTEIGQGSLGDALMFVTSIGVVILFINLPDPEL
jgi:predicted small integral membrane protein